MTFTEATTPEDLHARIDASRRALTPEQRAWEDQEHSDMLGSARARRYAPHNRALIEDMPGERPSADAWVVRSINDLFNPERFIVNVSGDPLAASQAYIVLSGDQFVHTAKFGRGDREFRTAYPLASDRGPVLDPHIGKCDRCWLAKTILTGSPTMPESLVPIHVARGRWVAELHLCSDCTDSLARSIGAPLVPASRR